MSTPSEQRSQRIPEKAATASPPTDEHDTTSSTDLPLRQLHTSTPPIRQYATTHRLGFQLLPPPLPLTLPHRDRTDQPRSRGLAPTQPVRTRPYLTPGQRRELQNSAQEALDAVNAMEEERAVVEAEMEEWFARGEGEGSEREERGKGSAWWCWECLGWGRGCGC